MTSVIAVIFKNKKVLLIKRRDVPVWVLPGGGVEENETPEEAVIREVFEETGCQSAIKRKVGEYLPAGFFTKHTFLYECRLLDENLSTGNETKEIGFFSLKLLPKKLPTPFDTWIEDAKKNLPYPLKKKIDSLKLTKVIQYIFLHPLLTFRYFLSKIGLTINS